MLLLKENLLIYAVLVVSVSGGLIIQNPSLFDKDGKTICTNLQEKDACKVQSYQYAVLHFNLTVDQFVSFPSFELHLGKESLLDYDYAELCYDFVSQKVVVIESYFPPFCFLQKSRKPYPVEVAFTIPKIKDEEVLLLNAGPTKSSIKLTSLDTTKKNNESNNDASHDKSGSNTDVSHNNPQPGKTNDSHSDLCMEGKEDQHFQAPIIVNSKVFNIEHPSLLDEKGQESCIISSGSQLCKVHPNQKMILRFNLTLSETVVRPGFSLFVGNVSILTENRVCYDFDSKKVFIQTKETKNVCYTLIRPADTPFLVELPFEVPPFEGQELIFYIDSARALLILSSGLDDDNKSFAKPPQGNERQKGEPKDCLTQPSLTPESRTLPGRPKQTTSTTTPPPTTTDLPTTTTVVIPTELPHTTINPPPPPSIKPPTKKPPVNKPPSPKPPSPKPPSPKPPSPKPSSPKPPSHKQPPPQWPSPPKWPYKPPTWKTPWP